MQLVGYVLPQMGLVVPSANEGGALGVFTIAAIALAVAGAALWATEHAFTQIRKPNVRAPIGNSATSSSVTVIPKVAIGPKAVSLQ